METYAEVYAALLCSDEGDQKRRGSGCGLLQPSLVVLTRVQGQAAFAKQERRYGTDMAESLAIAGRRIELLPSPS
jgi:hypothetical protein